MSQLAFATTLKFPVHGIQVTWTCSNSSSSSDRPPPMPAHSICILEVGLTRASVTTKLFASTHILPKSKVTAVCDIDPPAHPSRSTTELAFCPLNLSATLSYQNCPGDVPDGVPELICVIIFQMTSTNWNFIFYVIANTLTRNSFDAGAIGAVTMIRFAVEYVQSNT